MSAVDHVMISARLVRRDGSQIMVDAKEAMLKDRGLPPDTVCKFEYLDDRDVYKLTVDHEYYLNVSVDFGFGPKGEEAPRQMVAGETPGYQNWEIYYLPTGLAIPNVHSVDLDKQECWQHVIDPISKRPQMEGANRVKMRRVRGEIGARRINR